jgi:hypothetical protein
MYAIIRRYTMKSGAIDRGMMEDLKRRTENEFAPVVQDIRGFHSYYMMNVDDRELVTVGVFEDRTGVAESTRRATEFVKTLPIKDQLDSPELIEGELLVSREAAVGAR